jgi:hypothetical protein
MPILSARVFRKPNGWWAWEIKDVFQGSERIIPKVNEHKFKSEQNARFALNAYLSHRQGKRR